MVTLYVKKGFLETSNRFTILDEKKKQLYDAKGNKKIRDTAYLIHDHSGEIRARVHKSLNKKQLFFHIEVGEKEIATITTNKGFVTKGFAIEPQGMITKHNKSKLVYTVVQNGEMVATINTKLLRFKSTYMINIVEPDKEIKFIMIALTLFIDQINPSLIGSVFRRLDWLG